MMRLWLKTPQSEQMAGALGMAEGALIFLVIMLITGWAFA